MINKTEKIRVWQVWNQNGTSCPEQTIPIRHSMVRLKRFRKNHWTDVRVNRRTVPYAADEGHEYARDWRGGISAGNIWNSGNYERVEVESIYKGHIRKSGCLNLECSGGLQVSSQFAFGGVFSPPSSYGGNQYDITMFIWKDTNDGNWWLGIDSYFIGYWP
ncbi:predicted protein [Arabidopsis lyrata subsp. lyrata]|uniref:Predicted protein n=1 Tax=Arabidopsis lyrata subsp. lyrata TaxID=81972 RepID=D7LRK6_ARALL|nr:predicted protein [Arabidopsis lyrata subsp. lyrata]